MMKAEKFENSENDVRKVCRNGNSVLVSNDETFHQTLLNCVSTRYFAQIKHAFKDVYFNMYIVNYININSEIFCYFKIFTIVI